MNVPKDLLYTKTHEWVKMLENGNAQIGLTDYAQDQLSDIVFVNLGQEGDAIAIGDVLGDVESIKAVSEVYSTINGTIAKVNQDVLDSPETINSAPYDAWLVELSGVSGQNELLSSDAYEELLAKEQH